MLGRPPRVFLVCSGLGHAYRGYEAFARNCFETLAAGDDVDAWLVNAAGTPHGRERVARALRRGHAPARALAFATRRDDYRVECVSYGASLIPQLVRAKPDVVFLTDWPLAPLLGFVRRAARLRYKLLLHNGAPGLPPYPAAVDHVHQPTPHLLRLALEAGEPPARHSAVPLGVRVPATWEPPRDDERAALRTQLGLPRDRRVVLSVAALNNWHKRISYLVDEVAALPAEERPFLVLVGQRERETAEVLAAAEARLGPDGYLARSVPPAEVRDWYRAADAFVLASTTEGFGLVLLEAGAEGLPCICHDYPTTRFVLGDVGHYGDLRMPGTVARLLSELGDGDLSDDLRRRRHAWVRDNFSWQRLRPGYVDMIERCLAT